MCMVMWESKETPMFRGTIGFALRNSPDPQ
jgi:hypothetical protein